MTTTRSELEEMVAEVIIGNTIELDLGVRSWSNVSTHLSPTAVLYDSAWQRAVTIRKGKKEEKERKRRLARISGFRWRPSVLRLPAIPRSLVYGLAAVFFAGSAAAYGLHAWSSKEAVRGPVTASQYIERAKKSQDATVSSVVPLSKTVPQPQTPPVTVAASLIVPDPTPREVQTPVVVAVVPQKASTPAVIATRAHQPVAVKPHDQKPESKPVAVAVKAAPTATSASVTVAMPSLPPPPIGIPLQIASPRPVQVAAPKKEEPLLAVDDTAKAAVKAPPVAPAAPEEKKVERAAAMDAAPEPTQAVRTGPLPRYTVLAPTATGVVISDPATRLPREFKTGSRLPSGEIIKAIDPKSGQITTDRRTLRMAE